MALGEITLFTSLASLTKSHPIAKEIAYFTYKKGFSPVKCFRISQNDCDLDTRLLTASLQFLISDPNYYRSTWDWNEIWTLLGSKNDPIKWLSLQIVRILCSFSDKQYYDLCEKLFPCGYESFQIQFCDIYSSKSSASTDIQRLFPKFLEAFVQEIFGHYIIKYGNGSKKLVANKEIVIVPSLEPKLKAISAAISDGIPVLLEGPLGCGKTSLIEYIASCTGRYGPPELTKIQISNQFDSKLLIGSHCCTEVVGEFVWKPGPLTDAIAHGYWLIFEDIDLATPDVLTLLQSVIKTKSLEAVPNCLSPPSVDPRFRIFFTRRTADGLSEFFSSADKDLILKLCRVVKLENYTPEEISAIVSSKHSNLTDPSKGSVWEGVLKLFEVINKSHGSTNRQPSFRDLLKWCNRVKSYFTLESSNSQQKAYFQDASDCFIQCDPSLDVRIEKVEKIGPIFGINSVNSRNLLKEKPKISAKRDANCVIIGRVRLPKSSPKDAIIFSSKEPTFSYTLQSLTLLEKIAGCVCHNEPVLLVGETGVGKTKTVQYLSHLLDKKLTVINMNQQSESSDLLGGFKPMDLPNTLKSLREKFETLFFNTFTTSSEAKLKKFKSNFDVLFVGDSWFEKNKDSIFEKMLRLCEAVQNKAENSKDKAREFFLEDWKKLYQSLVRLKKETENNEAASTIFTYVEGSLLQSIRNGNWILLDEINLAESETLQCLSSILDSDDENLIIFDKADNEPIKKHSDFRLFACMNPSSDVGKKDLPIGIRHRFTEFFIEELESETDLQTIVDDYLKAVPSSIKQKKAQIVKFYLEVRKLSKTELKDATGGVPRFTLRTLCRALQAIADSCFSFKESHPLRIIHEAFCLSFLTQLSSHSKTVVENLIVKRLLGLKSVDLITKLPLKAPKSKNFVQVDDFFIPIGTEKPCLDENYKVSVPSVARNLRDVARIISLGRSYPILIQGETSVGKTSLIKYLADLTGNVCLRVNNHEHTDIQEYIGSYTNDENGKLVFQEGIFVEAMRKGYWIILDELNLASTEVLESLNRVLDENRELFIPETQKTVEAHPKFLVFATQNPPGHYGGRKLLSRAFRNRFIELHFDEIPKEDLIVILQERCDLAPTYAKKMVSTLYELRHRLHQSVSLSFAGKHGGVTLRDLFRWGERYRQFQRSISDKFYDWKRYLAIEGYFLFCGRSRSQLEVQLIIEVLKKQFDLKEFDPSAIIDEYFAKLLPKIPLPKKFSHIFWTSSLKRTMVLFFQALEFKEPVLLVGETGCGKTTICELFSAMKKQKEPLTVNCHMHSESADFLGRLSNVEEQGIGRFEWVDGPLVRAMQEGCMFLIDEISLADDSVLERLNSVIEPERTLLLTERGTKTDQKVKAHEEFDLVATMNPGGDHGKKELSPALRNRFTEIWCYSSNDLSDMNHIIEHNLQILSKKGNKSLVTKILSLFFEWFFKVQQQNGQTFASIRDVLAICSFITHSIDKANPNHRLDPANAIRHAIDLVFLDSNSIYKITSNQLSPDVCRNKLETIIASVKPNAKPRNYQLKLEPTENFVGISPFFIKQGPHFKSIDSLSFVFNADSVSKNAHRLLRAMQLSKPILIEGPPGVGKTSLVQSLAEATGHDIIRINLSEQTDIHDLFGAKLPQEGSIGEFQWRDGPLLTALKSDSCWILLDEMNLASQSVLEGLNACFDHRGEIFIPELGETFRVNKQVTRIFASQNPHAQGGDRKGLPKSFLNRFTVIYMNILTSNDLAFIVENTFRCLPRGIIQKMVLFNEKVNHEISTNHTFARCGSPWEFNLRDILKWCKYVQENSPVDPSGQIIFNGADLIYNLRFRSESDRLLVDNIYESVFDFIPSRPPVEVNIYPQVLHIGQSLIQRPCNRYSQNKWTLRHDQAHILEALIKSIQINPMVLLVGPSQSGKSSCVNILSRLTGNDLKVLSVNTETDTIELLGGFDQNDVFRDLCRLESSIERMIWQFVSSITTNESKIRDARIILKSWKKYKSISYKDLKTFEDFLEHSEKLATISAKIGAMEECSIFQDLNKLRRYVLERKSLTSRGAFQWISSVLVDAVRDGSWLLIDDVNLCSASVLDRLNGVLEPNGELVLNEQGCLSGSIPKIKPHPSFRLFLTMDPKNGELSRAMRNRGIEICILPTPGLDSSSNDNIIIDFPEDLPLADISLLPTKIEDYEVVLGDVIASNALQEFSILDNFSSKSDFSPVDINALSFLELFFRLSSRSDFKLRISLTNNLKPSIMKDLDTYLLPFLNTATEYQKSLNFKPLNQESFLTLLIDYLPFDIRFRKCFWYNLITKLPKETEQILNKLPLALLKFKLETIQQITFESSSKSLRNCEKLTQFPVLETLSQIFRHLGCNGLCDDLYFSTRKIIYWIHDFITFTSKDIPNPKDDAGILDALLLRWVVLTDKLHSSQLYDVNSEVFINFNKVLHLPASITDDLIIRKKDLKSVLALPKCSQSAMIFEESFKLARMVLSSHSFCDTFCDHRDILDSIIDIYTSLYSSSPPLSELEQSLKRLDLRFRSKLASTACDKDELNDEELMKSFNQRTVDLKRKIGPLNCASFFFAEIKSMIDSASSEEADISRICLHPIHSFLYKMFDKNSSELLLHHLLDFERIIQLCELRKIRQLSSLAIERDETIEWQSDGYALELCPLIAYTFTQILCSQCSVGEISVKKDQNAIVQDFIVKNFSNLCNFNFFDRQFSLITDQVLQDKQSIVAYTEEKISSQIHLFDSLFSSSNQSSQLPAKAKHLLLLGTLLAHYQAPTMLIDPVQKWSVKLEQHCLELEYTEKELLMHKMYAFIKTGQGLDSRFAHPHVTRILKRKEVLVKKINKLQCRKGYRPIPSQYQRLRQQVNHFLNSKLSLEKMFGQIETFERTLDPSNKSDCKKEIDDCINLQKSLKSFVETLLGSFTVYYDITNKMILGIIIALKGLKVFHHLMTRRTSNVLSKIKLKEATILEDVCEIMILANPDPIKKAQKVISLVKSYVSLMRCTNPCLDIGRNTALLYKSALEDLKNSLSIDMLKISNGHKSALQCLTSIVESFSEAWEQQEKERKRKLAEEESIYQYKTKVHESDLPEDVQDEIDIRKRFPTFEEVFVDTAEEPEISTQQMECEQSEKNFIELRPKDIMDIHQLHQEVLEAILSSKLGTSSSYSKPVVYRFKFLTNFLDSFYPLFGEQLNTLSAESALLMSTVNQSFFLGNETAKVDFYKDPCPQELEECYAILESAKEKIFQELLPMSPGDPILHQILFVIGKIYDLPADCPLAKCVAGLEALLAVQMAHWKLRLESQIVSITNLVLKWRKIQLSNWSLLLDSVLDDIKCGQLARFWFYFYSFIHPMLTVKDEDNVDNRRRIVSILRRFIGESSLGEFECRLNLIKNFINHQLCIDISRSHSKLFFVLKNVHCYFDQFTSRIAEEVCSIRKPIDKELKACAKIMKWHDSNFENLKSETRKTHRTLHRLSKNFSKSLSAPSSKFLTLQFKFNTEDIKTEISAKKENDFTKSLTETSYPGCQLLSRSIKLTQRVRKFSAKIQRRHNKLLNLCEELHQKTMQLIDNEKELDKLKISPDIKEKSAYEKEWKSINNIKRQSLSMNLKQLTESGISYKKGIEYYNSMDIEEILLSSNPLDPQYSLHNSNHDLEQCNYYFYQSLYRLSDFQKSLLSPSQEIKSVRNVFDKMKGITGYLLHGIRTSREQLSSDLSLLKTLSQLKDSLVSVSAVVLKSKSSSSLTSLQKYEKWRQILASKFSSFLHILHQMKEFPPEISDALGFNFDFDTLLHVDNFPVKKIVAVDLVTRNDMIELEKAWTRVNLLSQQTHEILCKTEYSSISLPHHLIQICDEISSNYALFMAQRETLESELRKEAEQDPLKMIKSTEKTFEYILTDIQKLVKSSSRFSSRNETTTLASKDFLPLLAADLQAKIDTPRVIHSIKQIIDYVSSESFLCMKKDSKEEADKVLLRLATLLQSYYYLLDYLAELYTKSLLVRSKFLSSILYVFTTHCQKGFRLPPPFLDEEQSKKLGNDKLKNIQDAGLGEGEGLQDVSKKIETEDQLEDAKPDGADSSESNDKKDLKDEKDGIEMSDDFDAPEYGPDDRDVGGDEDEDGKSDYESDEKEQSDDLEKKMGDVENEKLEDLDDKMWGSEDEDEFASGDDLDYDGGGEDVADDDRLVAKEENTGLEEKKEDKEKEKEKNGKDGEREEINEMKIDEDDYQGERQDPFKQRDASQDNSEKNATDDQDEELPEEMQLDKDEGDSDNDASMDDDETEKMQDSNEPSLTEEPEDINLDEDDKPIEEEMKDVEQKDQGTEVEMLHEDQEEPPDEGMDQVNETSYPDNLDIQTTEIPIDSGIDKQSNTNVPKDPLLDTDSRNINENTDQTPHSIDEQRSDTGGSQQKGLESESLEGKARSKSIHDESSGREEEENASKPEMMKKKGQRSLSENSSKPSKRQKVLERYESNIEESEEDEEKSLTQREEKSSLVQHCLDEQKSKLEVTDLSEECESRKSRPKEEDDEGNKFDEEEQQKKEDESLSRSELMEIDVSIDSNEIKSIKASIDVNRQGNKDQRKHDIGKSNDDNNEEMVESFEDVVETAGVQRGPESQYYTSLESDDKCDVFCESWFDKLQHKLEKCTDKDPDKSVLDICRDAWFECEKTVSPLVYELCQQLQLILEPMKAAKMKGDFRTGKRLNMRKVIEYIASGYKKDKIWLRRTKPSKREYQIVLAIDDSSSMIDNQAKRMAFESIALLAKSLSLLDAGQLSVMSFGEDVKLLSSFDDTFTDTTGLKLLSQLNFAQMSTDIVELLDSASGYFLQNQSRRHSNNSSTAISQLLLIISDGRGINNKRGEQPVRQSVRNCRELGVFVLFIVLDSMENNQSILDIVKPVQEQGNYLLQRYMDSFPFPYYIILRDIMNMPKILGEALRKWFEMVTSSDR